MTSYVLDARSATNHFPGIGRYVSNLAQAMGAQLGAEERLLLLQDSSRRSRWQLPLATEQVQRLEMAVSPFALRQQWQIPRCLRGQQARLYHSPYYLMPYWTRLPTVLTLYDQIPRRFPHMVSARARLLFQLTTWLALRRADHVITISEATRRDLLAAYRLSPERITAVPLAPDSHFRPQLPAAMARIRRQYHLPDRYLLYVGINKPHKNLVRLLEAWKLVTEDMADPPTLLIAGAWDSRYPEPMTRAAELQLAESIRFLGPIPEKDLPALYTGAAVFVFPSLYEGFGLPVIEAMACGTAVACSNTSSLPEVAGDAALYFDPAIPRAIAGAIGRLLADEGLRNELAQRGMAQAAQFSWSKTAEATLRIYRQMTKPDA
ncbi:MAG TPA: glycosyltransferase family 1 protein [Anaerolineae bacterium]